ncbi:MULTISPECIES: family 43 glycosylhydrolase [Flavobacteriaceae]|uniref:family 43 glycosylhydrolase n=1 Tax=Flavobacteriaceae TaxID=49546 RepID=UPI001492DAD5|nr:MULTISPECIES: family 43 glycosylhydrolase [Allomuricauda]MDC6367652.1 family 43 glycosylhydrolase [Muricauda sp. AC10]
MIQRLMVMAAGIIFTFCLMSCKDKVRENEELRKNKIVQTKIRNPIVDGFFADPSMVKHNSKYYIYATVDPWGGDELAVFESSDFKNWEQKHLNWPTLEACKTENSSGARVWAPSVIQGKNKKFYMYVSVGSEIWLGVADNPLGPWKNAKADNTPIIGKNVRPDYHMIDAEVFIDDDEKVYLYWGSALTWEQESRCFMVELQDDMVSFNESMIKDVTPPNYFEAPFMLKRNNKYHLMYSQGKCIDATYMVRSAVGNTPYGPWVEEKNSPILSTAADSIPLGPGHHAVIKIKNQDYILYHRIKDNNNTLLRELAIDSLNFDKEGQMLAVNPDGGVLYESQ